SCYVRCRILQCHVAFTAEAVDFKMRMSSQIKRGRACDTDAWRARLPIMTTARWLPEAPALI
ncbi:MAG: hypothetical protein OIN84_09660, partial [Candidatus Methanoperedens sp.]|nr:hypothetical protein [Candidatus Methanoperedens sp.]